MKISSSSLLSCLLFLGLHTYLVDFASASNVISDERVRSLDVTPILGKGYGIQSNSYHSICLKFPTTTEPTYNYDYFLTDLTNANDEAKERALNGAIGGTFGAGWIGASAGFGASFNNTSTSSRNTKKQTVATTMRIDRYYSSIDERNAEFSDDAKTLLDRGDYMGFFKACGPNYIRSLRRAQEVTAKFTFETEDEDSATEMASHLKGSINGMKGDMGVQNTSRLNSTMSNLEIEIKAWGLGLDKEGSETLVAKSLDEFNAVMKFAYTSMTRGNEGSAETGMVYGMEVVPWVDNAIFQATINMETHQLNKAVDANLIPNARANGMCTKGVTDDISKCCLQSDMEDVPMPTISADVLSSEGVCTACKACSTSECTHDEQCQVGATCESVENVVKASELGCSGTFDYGKKHCMPKNKEKTMQVCRPVRPVPLSLMKQNTLSNAEFVTVMDSVLRSKINTAFALERCISSLRGIPSRHDNNFLKSADTVFDGDLEMSITVAELRHVLDPDGKLSTLQVLSLEMEEYMQKFYQPCLAALHGANDSGRDGNEVAGDPIETDRKLQSHFMASAYFEHEQCSHASCLLPNHRWDRHTGGCKPSILVGAVVGEEDTTKDLTDSGMTTNCSQQLNPDTMAYECKVSPERYTELLTDITTCWGNPAYVPLRLLDTFCQPRLSENRLSPENDRKHTRICTQPEEAANAGDTGSGGSAGDTGSGGSDTEE